MNKRQTKKRDQKLYKAIKELNEDVAKDLGRRPINERILAETFYYVKSNPISVQQTLRDYKKYILKR